MHCCTFVPSFAVLLFENLCHQGLGVVLSEHSHAQERGPPLQNDPFGLGGRRGALRALENHGHRPARLHRGGQPRLLRGQRVGQGECWASPPLGCLLCPPGPCTFVLLFALPNTPTESLLSWTPAHRFALTKDVLGWNPSFIRGWGGRKPFVFPFKTKLKERRSFKYQVPCQPQ